ncbi:MAG: hypothetical protein KDB03_03070 [Planctomycetales bacterium]|nr:hypothetical protein [Planctomycetales bacterium]
MLSITKKILPIIALSAAFAIGSGNNAHAQNGLSLQIPGLSYGGGTHGSYMINPFFVRPQYHFPGHYQSFYPSYNNGGGHYQHRFHDTEHLDWHAPTLQWHGNHLDFQPGHFDVHRTGHWH